MNGPSTPRMESYAPPPKVEAPLPVNDMHAAEKVRRISVALSHADHERLGIAAVKKDVSRHQIVRDALEYYFEKFSHDLNDRCSCMADGTGCQGSCGPA